MSGVVDTGPPAMPEALACLTTDADASLWRLPGVVRRMTERSIELGGPHCLPAVARWRHADVAEAWEALQAHGLAPADDDRRGWWCERCRGLGSLAHECEEPACSVDHGCLRCDGAGHAPRPPDRPSLAAVASLGLARWLTAEDLARAVERDAAVVWKTASRDSVRAALNRTMNVALNHGNEVAGVGIVATIAKFYPGELPSLLAWWSLRPERRAAQAVADLAALGVWVTACEPGRVTLAVESLG